MSVSVGASATVSVSAEAAFQRRHSAAARKTVEFIPFKDDSFRSGWAE
jgi:hypothetical protein